MYKILILDNYDSFTYNLFHYAEQLNFGRVSVFRNDEISIDEAGCYDVIIISPGPGLPDAAGNTKKIIEKYYSSRSILGVCLGMQAIAEVFGGTLKNLGRVYHGEASEINIIDKSDSLFINIPEKFMAGRYHSWVVDKTTIPDSLKITAQCNEKMPMALSHRHYNVKGVQFHPESIMTPVGLKLLENFFYSCTTFQEAMQR